ncbi:hypothetical protein [Pareuzebyella sediminis]|uniref:hypothetical protein n=1 Tax=Pareuzebyella sediminis TaxID=2607998 RepID=UPI0011EEFE74|nr:hypothetical protein [Pareuzebyella sediminis]
MCFLERYTSFFYFDIFSTFMGLKFKDSIYFLRKEMASHKLLLPIIGLLAVQCLYGQKYFKIENDMVDERTFREGLAMIAREYNPQIVTYKTFERVLVKDSIIENIAIVVLEEEEDEEVYRVFDFLDRPLPDFEFLDNTGALVKKGNFLGKYTVVGLYKEPGQVRSSHIKSMNNLVETGQYNAVALIAKNGKAEFMAKKADFPVLNECISWYIKNISIPESPKFLVLDEQGKLRYIFQTFPDRKSNARPMNPEHLKIFDLLK